MGNKVKLAWVVDENSRKKSLERIRLLLLKKVRELTILCDVNACLIIFSPDKAQPTVWPSDEAARDLLNDFFALPVLEKMRNVTTLESYLKEKTKKVHEKLMENRKKNMKHVVDRLMVQQERGRTIDEFNLSEIHDLLTFTRDKIMLLRKRLNSMPHAPLRDPPMHLFDVQSEDLLTTTMITSDQVTEKIRRIDEVAEMMRNDIVGEKGTYYLTDQWFFPSSEPPSPQIHQTTGLEMTSNDGITKEPPPDGLVAEEGNGDVNVI